MTIQQFQLSRVRGTPVSESELLADLKRVAEIMGTKKVSQPLYEKHGCFDARNLARRFGTWNNAISVAGLEISNEGEYSDERLFANILVLWQHFGRQPRRAELAHPPSVISQSPYQRRFLSWTGALESFVSWANMAEVDNELSSAVAALENRPKTGRDPSLRLRFRVLLRDRFTCCSCGSSPATTLGTELQVDHILAWSKGGETTLENLQALCSKCNFGKSNVM